MRSPALVAAASVLSVALGAWAAPAEPAAQTTAKPAPAPEAGTPREVAARRADLLMARKMYSEAVAAYLELLKEEPGNATLLNKTGVAYQQQSNLREASRYYHRALKADKTFATAFNNLGTVEYSNRKYRKAIRLYEKALKIHGDEPAFFSNLGFACLGDKQYDRALAAFRKALELDPSHFENRGTGGAVVSERSISDPGFYYFFLAKTYALIGNAERCAHYLKMSRDEGYKKFSEAGTDPVFAPVRNDPRVREILTPSSEGPAGSPGSGV